MPSLAELVAMSASVAFGAATVHHCRRLMFEGMELEDGGGWTVLIILEFVACMVATAVAINL